MKFILVGVVLIGMTYLGFGLSKYYRKRKRFFEDMVFLCGKLCVEISFSSDSLSAIIQNSMDNFSKDFKNMLKGYLDYLGKNGSEISVESLFGKSTLIKDDEKELFLNFFKNLGRLDASNQVQEIENFKEKFGEIKSHADDDNKKFGNLSLKLMMLLGILVVIILI